MRLYTVREVAALLRVSEATVQRWCREGKIKATRIYPKAREWTIDPQQFDVLFDQKEED